MRAALARDRPRASAQADHRQSVARRPAQGRLAFDLPIALCLLAAIGATDAESLSHYVAVGELGLDGRIAASPGVLLAALHAAARGMGLICPAVQGAEAAWAGDVEVVAAPDLLALLAHLKGTALVAPPVPGEAEPPGRRPRPRSRSKGRKSPSARSRSPRRAGITC